MLSSATQTFAQGILHGFVWRRTHILYLMLSLRLSFSFACVSINLMLLQRYLASLFSAKCTCACLSFTYCLLTISPLFCNEAQSRV